MRIPVELKPYKDEMLSSWLIRNSIAYGSDPSSWVSGIWLDYRAWTRDIDRHLPNDKISRLVKITSLSKEQVRNMTLEPLVEKATDEKNLDDKKAWGLVIPTGFRGGTKTNGTHFCSKCLSEPDFYIKKHWRLSWNVACPRHKQLLTLRCKKCHHVFSPYLIDYINNNMYLCTKCGFDLRESDIEEVESEVLAFQEILNDALFHNKIDKSLPLVEHSLPELYNTIKVLIKFFRTLNTLPKHYDIFDGIEVDRFDFSKDSNKETFEAMEIHDRVALISAVFKLFKLNLDEIKEILERSKINYKSFAGSSNNNSKTIDYLSSNLYLRPTSQTSYYQKEIKPRSKEEVEELMDEIRKYL